MKYLGFSFSKVVEFKVQRICAFSKTINELNCLVSIDRLFHCLSVDGKRKKEL